MSRRQTLSERWARQQQARAARAFSWGDIRWRQEWDFWTRMRQLPADVRGAVLKAAAGLAKLQNGYFAVVIRSGAQIAAAAGIAESTWWNYALHELVRVGFLQVQERGGGLIRGRPRTGRSNVYAVFGAAMKGPDGEVATHVPPRPRKPRSPAPPTGAAETAVTAPAGALAGSPPLARATGPP